MDNLIDDTRIHNGAQFKRQVRHDLRIEESDHTHAAGSLGQLTCKARVPDNDTSV